MGDSIHLKLKTEEATLSVHLVPAWYIQNQETQIRTNDKITVKGSRITFEGKPALVAMEITKGDEVLKLRNENGIPLCAGWRRR
jgi:hypothetical protein